MTDQPEQTNQTNEPGQDGEFPYVYFVAYAQGGRFGPVGFGNHAVGTRTRVTTFEAAQQFGVTIAEAMDYPAGTVVVINYQLLSEPAEDEV
ncbi:hypothetical protein ABZ671_01040 [Micromonospora sp. NPDC006766]|uniref:hypothetical protein n=1 Tax=Micromonospora sp. NPDC006766 TaxID=3154778 RepID=UPI0033C68B61